MSRRYRYLIRNPSGAEYEATTLADARRCQGIGGVIYDRNPKKAPTEVAALYVDVERGPYAGMAGVDAWGVERDAMTYAGPHPVVAHPPCGAWGNYAHKSHDSGVTGPVAVKQVRQFGGVLEHPKNSKLWRHCGMPRPGEAPDKWGGYSIEVFQRDWGHKALKTTWLYIVGTDDLPAFPRPSQSPGRVYRKPSGRLSYPLERMSKRARHLTPPRFAEWLVEVARRSAV